jgi:hypothetical protein
MTDPMPTHDALSLPMFWAGALMAFTPLAAAAAVLLVWWRQRARGRDASGAHDGPERRGDGAPADASSQP